MSAATERAAAAPHVHRLEAAGLSTEVLSAGPETGVPRLLLHGGGLDRARNAWREVLPALSARAPVVAPDLPGYGGTEGFGRPHDVPELGAWALALLDALGLERVDAIGNSMGGAIALWLACEHPDRIRRIVPVGSYGISRKALWHGGLRLHRIIGLSGRVASMARSLAGARLAAATVFSRPWRVTPAALEDLRREAWHQADERAFASFLAGEVTPEGFRSCMLDGLRDLRAPALFVHGRHDRMVPIWHAREAAKLAPGAQLLELDAGHWPMRECPRRFEEAVTKFLED